MQRKEREAIWPPVSSPQLHRDPAFRAAGGARHHCWVLENLNYKGWLTNHRLFIILTKIRNSRSKVVDVNNKKTIPPRIFSQTNEPLTDQTNHRSSKTWAKGGIFVLKSLWNGGFLPPFTGGFCEDVFDIFQNWKACNTTTESKYFFTLEITRVLEVQVFGHVHVLLYFDQITMER